mmetsp:Transcript_18969/g.44190  ORF Transcript_18969/g.44190 Transcript_18969/m.44190 type:complete len:317 (+) Transcript_18969:507-1457(+)
MALLLHTFNVQQALFNLLRLSLHLLGFRASGLLLEKLLHFFELTDRIIQGLQLFFLGCSLLHQLLPLVQVAGELGFCYLAAGPQNKGPDKGLRQWHSLHVLPIELGSFLLHVIGEKGKMAEPVRCKGRQSNGVKREEQHGQQACETACNHRGPSTAKVRANMSLSSRMESNHTRHKRPTEHDEVVPNRAEHPEDRTKTSDLMPGGLPDINLNNESLPEEDSVIDEDLPQVFIRCVCIDTLCKLLLHLHLVLPQLSTSSSDSVNKHHPGCNQHRCCDHLKPHPDLQDGNARASRTPIHNDGPHTNSCNGYLCQTNLN